MNFSTFLNEAGKATYSRVFGKPKSVASTWIAEFVFEDRIEEEKIKEWIESAGITDEYTITKSQRAIIVNFENAAKMKPAQVKEIKLLPGIMSAQRFKA